MHFCTDQGYTFGSCFVMLCQSVGELSKNKRANIQMKRLSEIANMLKFDNNILENSQTLAKWLETKHNSKGGSTISLVTLM